MADLTGRTITQLQADLKAGLVQVTDLLQATLKAIGESEAGERPLNAFLSVGGEELIECAGSLERALAAGEDLGPLTGIPVALKDNLCTLDLRTTAGSRILERYLSPYESTVARKLRAAGALIVGKTNMDEFSMGSSSENSAYGATRNPWDRTRVPGGSSGGSAAAVAAGLVAASLGSDTGGSIRQPASFCGVVGLKPTYGRVSRYGLIAFASSLDQIGPITRSVEDAAIVLGVISGADSRDSTALDVPVPDFTAELEAGVTGLVIGVPSEYFADDLDKGIAALCHEAVERLAELGAEVREVSLANTKFAVPAYYLVANAEASSNLARYDGVRYGFRATGADTTSAVYRRTRGIGFGPEVKRRVTLGTYGLSAGYYEAYYGRGEGVRDLVRSDFARAFADGVDVLFAPTAPSVAFPLGERVSDPLQMYMSDVFTVTANLAELPAVSIPIGKVNGLPVGGQLLAPRLDEVTLLRVAAALERSLGEVSPSAPRSDGRDW